MAKQINLQVKQKVPQAYSIQKEVRKKMSSRKAGGGIYKEYQGLMNTDREHAHGL